MKKVEPMPSDVFVSCSSSSGYQEKKVEPAATIPPTNTKTQPKRNAEDRHPLEGMAKQQATRKYQIPQVTAEVQNDQVKAETVPLGPLDFSLFTVPQLQEWLRERGRTVSGRTEMLLQRAEDVLVQEMLKTPANKARGCAGHVVVSPVEVASSSRGPARRAASAPSVRFCTHPTRAMKNRANQHASWRVCGDCKTRLTYTSKRTGTTTYHVAGQTHEELVCESLNDCGQTVKSAGVYHVHHG